MAVPLGIYSKSILTIINSFILSISHWLSAARPKTLPLALASIVTGSCIAYSQGSHFWSVSLLALLTATLLQIYPTLPMTMVMLSTVPTMKRELAPSEPYSQGL